MRKKIFGKTGEEVSILGLGCMRLPLSSPSPTDIDYPLATSMLRKAVDNGLNYIDTAYPYHSSNSPYVEGESEVFVGHALKDGYRSKVKLATKLPTWMVSTKKEMHALLDKQLKRLQTDRIDFYLAHALKRTSWEAMKAAGMLEFFDEARKDGRIKHAGFSFHDLYTTFEEIVQGYDWEFAQIQYNYLDVDYQAGRRGAELAKKRGLGLVVMEPLRGGFLINHMPEPMRAFLAGLRPDWSLADWGLRWLWSRPEVDVVLSGMSAMAQIDENLAIAANPGAMSEAECAALDKVRAYLEEHLPINCTGCGYCLPCPNGVKIPAVFSVYNDYYLMDADAPRNRARFVYSFQLSPGETAGSCVHCRQCESKCPQNIPISENMAKAAELFEKKT